MAMYQPHQTKGSLCCRFSLWGHPLSDKPASQGRFQLQLRQTATKTKELFRARPLGQCGRRRRCLHALCHGSQWPWLTSPVLSASPAVARARRALNHLHPLVTSGSANNSVCFLRVHSSSWPCPRYSEAIPARSCSMSVPGLPQLRKGKPRTSCGSTKRSKPYGS